jgi:hypothetical protein
LSTGLSGKDGLDRKKATKTTPPKDDLILTRNSVKEDDGILRTLEIPSFDALETDAILCVLV